jgi:hypothetical protein
MGFLVFLFNLGKGSVRESRDKIKYFSGLLFFFLTSLFRLLALNQNGCRVIKTIIQIRAGGQRGNSPSRRAHPRLSAL